MKKNNFGKNFAESIYSSSSKKNSQKFSLDETASPLGLRRQDIFQSSEKVSQIRLVFYYITAFAIFAIFCLRLIHLQVIKGEDFSLKSENNRVKIDNLYAPRGEIKDRNGTVLARNDAAYRLVKENESRLVSVETGQKLIEQNEAFLDKEGPLGRLFEDTIRVYPKGEAFAHILGYTGEITADDLGNDSNSYLTGDRIGKMGVEQSFENLLKGKHGKKLYEVDSTRMEERIIGVEDPKIGGSLELTIDAELQIKLFEEMKKEIEKAKVTSGSALAQDPKTGEILAMVSYPSFDNNIFSNRIEGDAFSDLVNNPDNPLFNRAISGIYPPGSVYKIVSSLVGLESGKITPETRFVDEGEIFLGPFKFTNWFWTQYGRKEEGELDVSRAIARSNDIFFYRLGMAVGEKELQLGSREYGLGEKTGIVLNGENAGLVPDEEWKLRVKNEPWYPGNTLQMAIGQSDLLVTPLQVANFTSASAIDGILHRPKIARFVSFSDGRVEEIDLASEIRKVNARPEWLALVREGLKQACLTGGTGYPFFNFKIPVGCKTGTAEFAETEETHAWFTVFAPFDAPSITLTVLVERGGEGSAVAAPVARNTLEWYFSSIR